MMININPKIFSAINFLNIGSIYDYLNYLLLLLLLLLFMTINGAILIIGGKGYIVCLLEVK